MEVVPGHRVEAALAETAARNPLSAMGLGSDDADVAAASLFTSPPLLSSMIDAVGAVTGARERRVACSLMVMGYTTRLISPALGVLLSHGILLAADPANVRVSYAPGAGMRLALARPAGWTADDDTLHTRGVDLLHDHVAALLRAARQVTPVAMGLLWGNAASSALGALRSLALSGVPGDGRCAAFAARLLGHGDFAGTGTLTVRDGVPVFRRRSCCLYYRLPQGGFCGDCPLPK